MAYIYTIPFCLPTLTLFEALKGVKGNKRDYQFLCRTMKFKYSVPKNHFNVYLGIDILNFYIAFIHTKTRYYYTTKYSLFKCTCLNT